MSVLGGYICPKGPVYRATLAATQRKEAEARELTNRIAEQRRADKEAKAKAAREAAELAADQKKKAAELAEIARKAKAFNTSKGFRLDGEERRPTVMQILHAVARHYSVSVDEITCGRRTANIMIPRQTAMYLAKELTVLTMPQIALAFGGRDHTTILHGWRALPKKIDRERATGSDAIAQSIIQIREDLARREKA